MYGLVLLLSAAHAPCHPVTMPEVSQRVATILANADAPPTFDEPFSDLLHWWFIACRKSKDRIGAAAAPEFAKLLPYFSYTYYTAALLYDIGPRSRTATPAIRAERTRQIGLWREQRKYTITGLSPKTNVDALGCVLEVIDTGRRERRLCRYLAFTIRTQTHPDWVPRGLRTS